MSNPWENQNQQQQTGAPGSWGGAPPQQPADQQPAWGVSVQNPMTGVPGTAPPQQEAQAQWGASPAQPEEQKQGFQQPAPSVANLPSAQQQQQQQREPYSQSFGIFQQPVPVQNPFSHQQNLGQNEQQPPSQHQASMESAQSLSSYGKSQTGQPRTPIGVKPVYTVLADKCHPSAPSTIACALLANLIKKVGFNKAVAINFGVGFAGAQIALLYHAMQFGDGLVVKSIGGGIESFGQDLSEEARFSFHKHLSVAFSVQQKDRAKKVEYGHKFIQQLEVGNTMALFYECIKKLMIQRCADFHFDRAESTSKQYAENLDKNPALAKKVVEDSCKTFGTQSREMLEDTFRFIQYTLNGNIFIYDLESGLAQPKVLQKQNNNAKVFNFPDVHILIFSQSEIYLVIPENLTSSIDMCQRELQNIHPNNFEGLQNFLEKEENSFNQQKMSNPSLGAQPSALDEYKRFENEETVKLKEMLDELNKIVSPLEFTAIKARDLKNPPLYLGGKIKIALKKFQEIKAKKISIEQYLEESYQNETLAEELTKKDSGENMRESVDYYEFLGAQLEQKLDALAVVIQKQQYVEPYQFHGLKNQPSQKAASNIAQNNQQPVQQQSMQQQQQNTGWMPQNTNPPLGQSAGLKDFNKPADQQQQQPSPWGAPPATQPGTQPGGWGNQQQQQPFNQNPMGGAPPQADTWGQPNQAEGWGGQQQQQQPNNFGQQQQQNNFGQQQQQQPNNFGQPPEAQINPGFGQPMDGGVPPNQGFDPNQAPPQNPGAWGGPADQNFGGGMGGAPPGQFGGPQGDMGQQQQQNMGGQGPPPSGWQG